MHMYAGATHEPTASQDVTGECDVTEECGWKPVFPYSTAIHGNSNDFWLALSLCLETAPAFIIVLQRERHNIVAQVAVDKKSAAGGRKRGKRKQKKSNEKSLLQEESFLSFDTRQQRKTERKGKCFSCKDLLF